MHLSPAATVDAIRLLDSRLSGLASAENCGDMLVSARDEICKCLMGERLVERATGIEPVSEAWEASVLPLY
jgi:hypothetical protein